MNDNSENAFENYPTTDAGIPIIRVDQDHQGINGREEKIYEIPYSKSFIVDLNNFEFAPVHELGVGAKHVIQAIDADDSAYVVQIVPGEQIYSFAPPQGFKNHEIVLFIGYVSLKGMKSDFQPQWMSLIQMSKPQSDNHPF
ncbi:MAG: hypothetical protein IAF58_07220 [Leptolyngbya sp.]|nr:hypothetical protein [Candidatus Melainabacteria bacterium]